MVALLLIFLVSVSASTAVAANKLTVYEALETYDFPVGILPLGVTSYELNTATGRFSVYLNKTCTFTIQGYNLKYHTKITGTISKDKIKNLTGIQVRVLFWFNIVQVTKEDGDLYFSVGILSAGFPVDSFYESPQCGCGFTCVNMGRRGSGKLSLRSLVFSA